MARIARVELIRVGCLAVGASLALSGCGILRAVSTTDTMGSNSDDYTPSPTSQPTASSESQVYTTKGNKLCPSEYNPIESELNPLEFTKLETIKDLPLGSLHYVSSEFFIEGGFNNDRSQLHVSHPEGTNESSVVCMSYRYDSPALDWVAAYPRMVTRGEGMPRKIEWQPIRGVVNSKVNGQKLAWHYNYSGDASTEAFKNKRVGSDEYGNRYSTWYRVGEGQYELRSAITDGANRGMLRVRYKLVPASNGFERLKVGKYQFVAAFSSYSNEVNGEKLALDFASYAGSKDKYESKLTKSIGLDAGISFEANMDAIIGFEKTGPRSARAVTSNFWFRCGGRGGYEFRPSPPEAVIRSNIRSFTDLGFSDDLGVEAIPGHPNQIALTRNGEHHRVTVILERVTAEVEPALVD